MAEEKAGDSQEKSTRNKKINKMTLDEIERKLEVIKGDMGGHSSRYAQELLRRRAILGSN